MATTLALTARPVPVTGREAVAMYATMTDRLRNARAVQIVESITDPDMLVRIIRAAADGLSGYALGANTITDGCDLVQADLDHENARQMGAA